MDLATLDAAIRLAAMTVALLLAWLLFRQRRGMGLPALLFPPMALCLAGFLIGNTPDPSLRLSGWPAAAASFASGCTVVFLWWFCLACFDRRFRPRGIVLAVGLCWVVLAGAARIAAPPVPALSYTLLGLGFAIVTHLIWRLYAEREGDLIEKRYDARAMVAVLLGGLLLIDLLADLVLGFEWRPRAFAMAQNAAILGFGLWLAAQVLGVRSGILSFDGGLAAEPGPLPAETGAGEGGIDQALRRRLDDLIEVERIHLDPDLTFAQFVQRMNAPERAVRRLVNHELGFDHFRSFLNHYRMIEACRLLSDPRRSGDKLIAVAFDSGFASLPSFNRVFRAAEACSPGQYKEAALAAAATAPAPERPPETAAEPGFEKRSAAF